MITEEFTQAADTNIKSAKKQNDFKHFYCKLPKPSWLILKKAAVMQDDTMVNVLCYLLSKYEKSLSDKFDKIK
jgi:Zn-dependent M32 family carboxypeptidase